MIEPIPQVQSWMTAAEKEAAARVIDSNWLTEGVECNAFAQRLNHLIGVPYGVFAPNGTLALALGLMALDIGPGDEVLVPDTTFIGSATAILLAGATPVFVDVETDTYQIDLQHAEKLVRARTRAIMPVHLYGSSCDMDSVVNFAARHQLRVIEDAAQGIGVTYRGRHVGGLGDVGCFSFFADKTLTTGEGGYVVCRDAEIYERLRYLRNQGRQERGSFIHPMIGYNFRITDMQAAIGLAQLDRLPEIIARKNTLYAEYCRRLNGIEEIRLLDAGRASSYVPFRCVLIADHIRELELHFQQANVQTRTFFYPLHRQPCFKGKPKKRGWRASLDDADYPGAVHGYDHGLCLPIFPTLEVSQVGYIVDRVKEFYAHAGRREFTGGSKAVKIAKPMATSKLRAASQKSTAAGSD